MMKNRKSMTVAAAMAMTAIIGVGATMAYFSDQEAVTNVITMGHVNIELTEPEFDKNPDNTITNVRPGQTITKDPTITVKADSEACYIRAEISYENLDEEFIPDIEKTMNIGDGWKQSPKDGRWYYQTKVEDTDADQEFLFFNQLMIPRLWDNYMADKTFHINISAAAIQADNFTPTTENGVIVGWNDEDGGEIYTEKYTPAVLN